MIDQKPLEKAVARLNAARDEVQAVLANFRQGCQHTHVLRTEAGGGQSGYMWRCVECHVEVHGWSHCRNMRADWTKEVSRDAFLKGRPPGPLHELQRDGSIT